MMFHFDMNPVDNLDRVFAWFWSERQDASAKSREFAEGLVRGVVTHRVEIDELIRSCAENWDLNRIGAVERSALRMAIYEMRFREDIPPVVSINEAVDLAKYFSSMDSGKFVNGILDRIRKSLKRPSRTVGKRSAV